MEKHVRYVEDVYQDMNRSPGAYARSQKLSKSRSKSNSSRTSNGKNSGNVSDDEVKAVDVAAAKLSLQWPILSAKDVRKAKSMAGKGINNSKATISKMSTNDPQNAKKKEGRVTLADLEKAYEALGMGKPVLLEKEDNSGLPKVNLKPFVNHIAEGSKRKNVETMWPGFGPSPLEPELKAKINQALRDMNRYDSTYMRSAQNLSTLYEMDGQSDVAENDRMSSDWNRNGSEISHSGRSKAKKTKSGRPSVKLVVGSGTSCMK